MDIRILRYFLAIAREENITRAAESLHITQPSLSKQIIELENELGKKLLIRGKRKVTLTESGNLLRRRAEEIVSLFEKTEKEVSSDLKEICGEITIGGNPTKSILYTAANLRKNYPNVKFNFYSSDAIDVIERLENGSVDFAILLRPINTLKYDFVLLKDVSRWGLVVRKDSELAKKAVVRREDILKEPLVFHRRVGLQRKIAIWAKTEPEDLNIAATYNVVNGNPANFVKSGLGSFLTTRDLLNPELDNSLCFCPLEPPLEGSYAFVWRRHSLLSKAAIKFIEMLKENQY